MPDIRETGKIYCIEDAHTRSSSSKNQHTESLNINSVALGRHSDGYQCYGFFKFANHGIPENAVIMSASFGGRIYERLQAKVFALTARPCSGAWEDTEITYKTMPTSTGVSDQVSMGDQYSYFSADITSIAQAWLSGEFAYEDGLYVTSSEASSYKRVYSCTAADANKPYIEMTYYVPASRPTADKDTTEIAAGSAVTITTNRLSDDYTHTLSWALGSKTGEIAKGVTSSYAWTLTEADVSALLAALPNAESGTLKIICETFDASGVSLGKESLGITATIPAGVRPIVSEISITGIDLGGGSYFLQNVSRMQVDVTAAPGAGAEIASVIVTADGRTYSGASVTTETLKNSGSVRVSVSVKDTRGRSVQTGYASTIPVYAYSAPTLNAFVIERCTEDGSAVQIDGEYLRFTLEARSSLVAMPTVNRVKAEIYTKLRSAAEWTLSGSYGDTDNALSLENAVLPGTYSPLASYDVRLLLTDTFGVQTERRTIITTATSLLHFDAAHKRVTAGRIGEDADPERALITALDLIAEAGVSLHGADIADGQANLPDGGMIAAKAGFAPQVSGGVMRTLESVTVTATGKNLLAYPYWRSTQTVNSGIVYTVNADGTIHANGAPGNTAAWSNFQLHDYINGKKGDGGMFALPAGKWKLVCEGAKNTNKLYMVLYRRNVEENSYVSVAQTRDGTEAAFTTTEYCDTYYVLIACAPGYAPDDETLRVMIVPEDADAAYEPYEANVLTCDMGAALPGAEIDFASGKWRETWGYNASYAGETVPDGWVSSTGALDTGAQVAYPLATPVEHAMLPRLLAAPQGCTAVMTNADSLTGFVAGGRIFHTIARAINALGEA